MTGTAPRHLLDLANLGPGMLRTLLDAAAARKATRAGRRNGLPDDDRPLADHVLAAIFEKPSTRTRLSFDMAMRQLGGATITLAAGDMQLGRGETIEDTARVVSSYVDAAMIRANRHADILAFARAAAIPTINGLSDLSHPCQILADLLTVEERLGRGVGGTRWAWMGDGNNVCNSIIEAAGLLGFTLHVACPRGYEPHNSYVAAARERGATIELGMTAPEAAADADVVVTDTWVSMGQESQAARIAAMVPYQVNPALMARAAPHAVFLHCLPVHRGEEVTGTVIDGPQSAVWQEAENRLHAQKAVLLWALGKLGGN